MHIISLHNVKAIELDTTNVYEGDRPFASRKITVVSTEYNGTETRVTLILFADADKADALKL